MEISLNVDIKNNINNDVIQQLKILQYSYLEISQEIKREFQENPMVEIEENNISVEELLYMSENNISSRVGKKEKSSFIEKEYNKSLSEYIIEQVLLENKFNSEDTDILETLAYSIEETGYLNCEIEEIESLYEIETKKIQKILEAIHKIEPKGIGAKDIKECLILQLNKEDKNYRLTSEIIENYLEIIASNNLYLLSKKTSVDIEVVKDIVEDIKRLNPKPGYNVETRHENITYLYPEIKIIEEKGRYDVVIREDYYPKIYINKEYEQMLKTNEDFEGINFLKSKYKSGILLIRNIQRRKETLKRVVNEILEEQKAFFYEDKELKSLSLKDLSEKLGLHQSTVGRTIRNKYLESPKGIYSLNYFFSNYNTGIEEQSYIFIANKIKEVVSKEDKSKPLSDEKIKEDLFKEGINISRRTITKYREKENIPSSKKRKIF